MIVKIGTVMWPRGWRCVIEINRYGNWMKHRVRSCVGNVRKVRPENVRLDRQRNVECTGVVKSEYRYGMRLFRARWRTQFYPFRWESLFYGTLELVVRWPCRDGRSALRVRAVITVVAHDCWRWNDWSYRTFRISEGTHTGTRAVIGVAVWRTQSRNGVMNETGIRRTVERWHFRMWKTQPVTCQKQDKFLE